jgi:hypothetical protein
MARKIPVSFLLLLIIFFTACAKKDSLKTASLHHHETISPEHLSASMDFSGVQSLKSSFHLGIKHKGQTKGSFEGLMLYKQPDLLYLKFFGPFGLTLAEAVFIKGTFQLLITPNDTMYTGPVPFTRLIPDSKALSGIASFIEEAGDLYILYSLNLSGSEAMLKGKFYFDRQTEKWKGIELYSERKQFLKLDIQKINDRVPVIFSIRIKDAEFFIELQNPEINRELPEDYFRSLEASKNLPFADFLRSLDPAR